MCQLPLTLALNLDVDASWKSSPTGSNWRLESRTAQTRSCRCVCKAIRQLYISECCTQLLDSGQSQGKENLRKEVEAQLAAAKAKIAALSAMLDQIRASPSTFRYLTLCVTHANPIDSTRTRKRTAGLVHGRRQMFATAGTQSTGRQREEAGDKGIASFNLGFVC